ncbi:histidine--tRNA ligase [Flavisolibacter ginsengisoli]|jgi:histidyl-tRNA synthetase|uniref:Histidine--tRNA ligase n=1 Tax=Flavisolibacter ginsengisoli DSM 18119 TaxID=1121884 RepID=A0A1M5AT21_9BACT|nr:histidine--tRNA ligase [Flavisolibacter ginsengisoli]SHF33354.1 histidyl-tRNA synthetase [Flavisolibacter ginsengisoli DSM 18119]
MSKPSIPQGTRDFGPDVVRKRAFIFNTIRSVFELYGFLPIETPAMENLETLMGKYGEEGDKLIFKILNNGLDNPAKEQQVREDFEKILQGKNNKGITERALKYDLTIPFARYVAMNHGQLTFPFKRYQVQPVWRADRPQKGRYREFYQCDADVVGSNSLLNEVEFVNLYTDVFSKLGIQGCELRINSRKILSALAEVCGGADKLTDITIAIDKLDKIGLEKVKEELSERGLTGEQVLVIEKYLDINGSNESKLAAIKELLLDTEDGKKGVNELEFILNIINDQRSKDENSKAGTTTSLIIDFTLARGLNYYTGIIFEAKAPGTVKIGSIGGGGRYDDLTGLFGVPNIPGVGISFGVDRIYDVMEELQLFPSKVEQGTRVLFFNTGLEESKKAYELLSSLRRSGIAAELFHEPTKFDKQFKYAEKKQIPFIIIIGSKELEEKAFIIKDLRSGEQRSIPFADISSLSFN